VPGGLAIDRLENRRALLQHFDTLRRDIDSSGLIGGMDTFAQQAYEIVTSPKVQSAFDLSKEDDKTRDLYGRTKFGQSTLLARRRPQARVRARRKRRARRVSERAPGLTAGRACDDVSPARHRPDEELHQRSRPPRADPELRRPDQGDHRLSTCSQAQGGSG